MYSAAPPSLLPYISFLKSLLPSTPAFQLWDSFLQISVITMISYLWEWINTSSFSHLLLIGHVLVYKYFRGDPRNPVSPLVLPSSSNVMPTFSSAVGILLPIIPSLKPSQSISPVSLWAKKSFPHWVRWISSGPSIFCVSKALPWLQKTKFWWKHQSWSQVLVSWAHLFHRVFLLITGRTEENTAYPCSWIF